MKARRFWMQIFVLSNLKQWQLFLDARRGDG